MAWQNVLGHDRIADYFRQAIAHGRLASSFLLTGDLGIGKRTFAVALAKALLCPNREDAELEACGQCASCTQVDARTHPDLLEVAKPADKSYLPLELLIGDKEHRMREGLCHDIAMKPYGGGRKIAVIDDADFLNVEGANALLKTLEEPPPRSVLILIGTSPAKQLPTIRSRCQLLRFRPLETDAVAELLLRHELVDDAELAAELARMSGGSLQRALDLHDEAIRAFREQFLPMLAKSPIDAVRVAKAVAAFVDDAGKEAPARRRRLHHAIAVALEFYRCVMHARSGVETPSASDGLRRAAEASPLSAEQAAENLERCLDAAEQVDRNVNLTTLVEHWITALK